MGFILLQVHVHNIPAVFVVAQVVSTWSRLRAINVITYVLCIQISDSVLNNCLAMLNVPLVYFISVSQAPAASH